MRHGRHQSHLIGSSIYRCRILNNTPIHPRRLQKAKLRDVENYRWRSYLATCFLNDTKEKGNERKGETITTIPQLRPQVRYCMSTEVKY